MCGTAEILMKNVRYNGNSNETCAVQWESSPDHPSRPIKTYDQRLYRPARKSGKTYNLWRIPPNHPSGPNQNIQSEALSFGPKPWEKTYNSTELGWLVGWAVDIPRRGHLRGQKQTSSFAARVANSWLTFDQNHQIFMNSIVCLTFCRIDP